MFCLQSNYNSCNDAWSFCTMNAQSSFAGAFVLGSAVTFTSLDDLNLHFRLSRRGDRERQRNGLRSQIRTRERKRIFRISFFIGRQLEGGGHLFEVKAHSICVDVASRYLLRPIWNSPNRQVRALFGGGNSLVKRVTRLTLSKLKWPTYQCDTIPKHPPSNVSQFSPNLTSTIASLTYREITVVLYHSTLSCTKAIQARPANNNFSARNKLGWNLMPLNWLLRFLASAITSGREAGGN